MGHFRSAIRRIYIFLTMPDFVMGKANQPARDFANRMNRQQLTGNK